MKSGKNVCGPDIPAEMDGGLKMKDIQKKYDKEIKAEIDFRGINDENLKPYEEVSMKEKRDLLKVDVTKILTAQLKSRDGNKPGDTC